MGVSTANRWGEYVTYILSRIRISGERNRRTHRTRSQVSVAGRSYYLYINPHAIWQPLTEQTVRCPIREAITSFGLCQDQHTERPPHVPIGNEELESFVRTHGKKENARQPDMCAGKGRVWSINGDGFWHGMAKLQGRNNKAANPTYDCKC